MRIHPGSAASSAAGIPAAIGEGQRWMMTLQGLQSMENASPMIGMAVFLLVLLVTWVVLRCRSDSGRQSRQGGHTGPDTWLGMLMVSAVMSLLLHLSLLYIYGMLSWWNAAGHVAGDTAVYCAAWLAERVKRELRGSKVLTIMPQVLDCVAGAVSVLFGLIANTYVLLQSVSVMNKEVTGPFDFDMYLVGAHLITLSVVTLLLLLWLLAVRDKVLFGKEAPIEASGSPIAGSSAEELHRRLAAAASAEDIKEDVKKEADAPVRQSHLRWLRIFKPKGSNMNLYGATLHLTVDVLQSVVLLVGGLFVAGGLITSLDRLASVSSLLVVFWTLVCSSAYALELVDMVMMQRTDDEAKREAVKR